MASSEKQFSVLILAAGQGTRMRSRLPKVLHPVCGVPMLQRVLRTVLSLRPRSVGIVVGQGADQVTAAIGSVEGVSFVRQKEQKGSGHAVQSASGWVRKARKRSRHLIVLCGDTPLISVETLDSLRRDHLRRKNAATILTASFQNPFGYGRIVKDSDGRVQRIVEEKDAAPEEKEIQEVNSGIYCFQADRLLEVLPLLRHDNAKREYYLTDVIEELYRRRAAVGSHLIYANEASALEALGINTRSDLAQAEAILQRRTTRLWMERGVTILNPGFTYIGEEVEIGPDTVLLPGTMIQGKTRIGRDCRIGPNAYIEGSTIGDRAHVRASFVYGSEVGEDARIGPFAHLRAGTRLEPDARIGNFTETKNAQIGRGAKVSHLSYIGDAQVGAEVNVGAGVITCNFDGKKKHRTVIGPRSFIGSNVNLVAPVTVGAQAVVGAGSTITEDVPDESLALERTRQIVKPGWARRRAR